MSDNRPEPRQNTPTPKDEALQRGERPEDLGPVLPRALAEDRRRLEALQEDLQLKEFVDRLEVVLPTERLVECATTVRNALGYRMLMSITAVDWKADFEVVYHLYRLDSAYPIVLRVRLPHEEESPLPSLTPSWPGADFQEREVYDLMGIVFEGHPDLRRILLDDDFPGHPLRKDFQQDPNYVLVPHLRVPGHPGARRGETSTGRFLDE